MSHKPQKLTKTNNTVLNNTEFGNQNLPKLEIHKQNTRESNFTQQRNPNESKSFFQKNNEMVSAALLDNQYITVEESVVDDLSHSDRAHDFSVTESYYQKANPEIMKSLDFDPKPLDNVKSML